MRYKTLTLDPRNGEIRARLASEAWPLFEDALNELASDGWEIECPPLTTSTDERGSKHMIILRHSTCDEVGDYRQQIKRQERRLAFARTRLGQLSQSDSNKMTLWREVEDHEKTLKKPLSELADIEQKKQRRT